MPGPTTIRTLLTVVELQTKVKEGLKTLKGTEKSLGAHARNLVGIKKVLNAAMVDLDKEQIAAAKEAIRDLKRVQDKEKTDALKAFAAKKAARMKELIARGVALRKGIDAERSAAEKEKALQARALAAKKAARMKELIARGVALRKGIDAERAARLKKAKEWVKELAARDRNNARQNAAIQKINSQRLAAIKVSAEKEKQVRVQAARETAAREMAIMQGAATRMRGFLRYAATGLGFAVFYGAQRLARSVLKDTADRADLSAVQSQQTGMTVEGIQRSRYISDIAGTKWGEVITTLRRLSDNAIDAAQGKGQGVEQFRKLGILDDIKAGKFKNTDQLFRAFMEARERGNFTKLEKSNIDTAGGRAGSKALGPIGEMGMAWFNNIWKKADAYGAVIPKTLALDQQKFNDELVHMRYVIMGIQNDLGIKFIPKFTKLLRAFREWWVLNRKFVKMGMNKVFLKIAKTLAIVSKLFERLDRVVNQFSNWGTVINAASWALASLVTILTGGLLVSSLTSLNLAISTMTGASMLSALSKFSKASWLAWTPWIAGAAAMGAVVLIAEDAATALRGGEALLSPKGAIGKYTTWGGLRPANPQATPGAVAMGHAYGSLPGVGSVTNNNSTSTSVTYQVGTSPADDRNAQATSGIWNMK